MKQRIGRSSRVFSAVQRGFTMVELAIVLVIAGLILTAVLKGTDTVNKAKVERAVADLRGLQGMILEHQKRVNRLPGDCDGDGVIELAVPNTTVRTLLSTGAVTLNNAERDPQQLRVCGTPNPTTDTNDMTGATGGGAIGSDVQNLVWNEMRRSGVVDGHRTNLELARHSNQDAYLISSITDAPSRTRSNVIVMYGIPVWMAEAIDAQIDGVQQDFGANTAMAGPACNGRVRRFDDNVAAFPVFTCTDARAQYNEGGLNRDDLVSILYQFDSVKLLN